MSSTRRHVAGGVGGRRGLPRKFRLVQSGAPRRGQPTAPVPMFYSLLRLLPGGDSAKIFTGVVVICGLSYLPMLTSARP